MKSTRNIRATIAKLERLGESRKCNCPPGAQFVGYVLEDDDGLPPDHVYCPRHMKPSAGAFILLEDAEV